MMLDGYRAKIYRVILALAALYNVAFGLWASFWPGSFFWLFELQPPRYPAIWQCLGMVIGLYGLAYGYAALYPERGRPFVAIGLAGKILGPIGWIVTVHAGDWPLRTFGLIVFNDIVWWLPFALFLADGTRTAAWIRRSAPYACSGLNALAAVLTLFALRGGTEVVTDPAQRAAYIVAHPILWRIGWLFWISAALSLLGFYAWWGARSAYSKWSITAFVLAAVGLAFDLTADSIYIGWLGSSMPLARFEALASLGTRLGPGIANGLYCLAGVILTAGARDLALGLRVWAWVVWLAGFGLTATALIGSLTGMVISATLTMVLFCSWTAVMGWRHR